MKVTRETAVALLVGTGRKNAKSLNDVKLLGALQGLPDKLDEESVDEAQEAIEDKDALKLLKAIVKDPSVLEDVEIVAESNGSAKAGKKGGKKAVEPEPEEEEEGDEEEDEAEEEEGDEDEDEEEGDEEGDEEEDEADEEEAPKAKKGKAADKKPTAKKVTEKKGTGGPRGRHHILGLSASSVVQWMGTKGWDFETARKVCNKLGAKEFKDSSIRTALTDCKNETYAHVAEPTKDQIKKLKEAAGK